MRISDWSSDVCSSDLDRATGEPRENTEWHSVSVFGEGLVNVVRNYLKKGAKVYIEGPQRTRKYEKDGVTHYATEVHVRGPGSTLTMLAGRSDSDNAGGGQRSQGGGTRSEERRVGKEGVRKCRSGWSPNN